MKKELLSALTMSALFVACTPTTNKQESNPLLTAGSLFMQAPAFDKITDADFRPAFEAGFKQQIEQIDSIVRNPESPGFTNTVVALEKSGEILHRVSNIFFGLAGANTSDSIRAIETDMSPRLAAHNDALYLNDSLFRRIKAVYENELEKLEGEDRRLLAYYYDAFVRAGAELNASDKEKLKALNAEEASLSTKFGQSLVEATNAAGVWVNDRDSLSGLSKETIAKAERDAKENGSKAKYLLLITNTTQQPQMASLDNRDMRRRMFEASIHRADHGKFDMRPTILRLAAVRAEKAKLLGFQNYAAWKLQNQMAKNPEAVYQFLARIVPGYSKRAKADAAEIESFARKTAGADFKLEAWDWPYYAEKLRKEKYNVDEEEINKYFVLDSVLEKGVFFTANKLYGLTFKQRSDLPVYHKDVKVYDVFDKDGKQLALFYTDYFKRPTKSGGAWMSNWVEQSTLEGTMPVIYNVCNYTKPETGKPCLLSFDQVETLFHEFGHALHGMFASQKYRSLSGTSVPRDFVELPSQFNEHWATEPTVFANYAHHYETHAAMPDTLIQRFMAARNFNQAYSLGENLSAVCLDLGWHTLSPEKIPTDVNTFQNEVLTQMGLLNAQIPPRYMSSIFNHIFSGGYAAGYYSYLWSEALDNNCYQWFVANGGMTRANGQRFRDLILSRGFSGDPAEYFTEFTGLTAPNVADLLKARGI